MKKLGKISPQDWTLQTQWSGEVSLEFVWMEWEDGLPSEDLISFQTVKIVLKTIPEWFMLVTGPFIEFSDIIDNKSFSDHTSDFPFPTHLLLFLFNKLI